MKYQYKVLEWDLDDPNLHDEDNLARLNKEAAAGWRFVKQMSHKWVLLEKETKRPTPNTGPR
jgi:hypothetical protein